ncbi:MAG: hypothetical protein AB8B73_10375 [Ekhidna sp.]
MIIIIAVSTLVSVFGNIMIAHYQKNDFRDWIPLSILIGPLSWPLHWYISEVEF